jgi:hypothetical protein
MDPNSAAGSANKQLQTLQNVVDRHDGGGAKSTGRKHAQACNIHGLEHLEGEMQTCVMQTCVRQQGNDPGAADEYNLRRCVSMAQSLEG